MCQHWFFGGFFFHAKKDMEDIVKQYRMILNVKELNHHVQYIHFKMDSLEFCSTLIEHDCFMAGNSSIDMEDACHSVPIHPNYTKYLKFIINERLYKYFVLHKGYRDKHMILIVKPLYLRVVW